MIANKLVHHSINQCIVFCYKESMRKYSNFLHKYLYIHHNKFYYYLKFKILIHKFNYLSLGQFALVICFAYSVTKLQLTKLFNNYINELFIKMEN